MFCDSSPFLSEVSTEALPIISGKWGLGLVIQIEKVFHVTYETQSVLRKKKNHPHIFLNINLL